MATAADEGRDLVLRLEPRAVAAREARHALARQGLPEPVEQTVALLVTEVVGNAVRHAGLGPEDRIEVVARLGRDRARVEVHDPGQCFEPATASGDGYGLRLLGRLATRWGVEREGGCRVWFEVTSPRSPGRP